MAIHHSTLETWLHHQLPSTLDLLRQMVEINSFTDNAEGVNRLGLLTAEAFASLGFVAQTVPSNHPLHGNHLILRRPGKGGPRIGLVTHLDTVFPPEEEIRQSFRWQPEGDRIYGPGTCDIKGGTVMIHLVLSALQALDVELFNHVEWVILADAHEEQLAEDFGRLCLQELGPNPLACLIFEAGLKQESTFSLVVARKGRFEFKVQAKGRAAHAGSANSQGVNAIVQIAHLLPHIAALAQNDQELTVNLGRIEGGTVVNRVPHQAEVWGEVRAYRPEVLAQAKEALLALDNLELAGIPRVRSKNDDHPAEITVEILNESLPWPRNQDSDRLYGIWTEAAKELGWKTLAEHRGGLSDGNYLALNVPVLDGLGPSGGNDHCSERSSDGSKLPEYVDTNSIVPKALLNVEAIQRLVLGAKASA